MQNFDLDMVRGRSQLDEFLRDLKCAKQETDIDVDLGGDSRWIDPINLQLQK